MFVLFQCWLQELLHGEYTTFFGTAFIFLTKPSWYHIVPDVDECASPETNECHLNAVCTNTEGTYVCRCKKGFSGNGKNCTGKIPKVFRFFFMLNFIIPFFLSFWEVTLSQRYLFSNCDFFLLWTIGGREHRCCH